MIDRRTLLKTTLLSLGAAAGPTWARPLLAQSKTPRPHEHGFLTAFTDDQGGHHIAILNAEGKVRHQRPVPSRAHGAIFSNDGRQAAFFARRPGTWMQVLDLETGESVGTANPVPGHHFYGHGVFSADGQWLYASENNFGKGLGVIGIWDARTLVRVGEWSSHGIGPHEIALLPDGETLVIAVGGILTHPDMGRAKLNIHEMAPSLTYLDARSGRLLDSVEPPHHQLSLRHLCVGTDGTVYVAAQFEGPGGLGLPLVYRHRQGQALSALDGLPEQERQLLKDYIASIALSQNGKHLVTTSPHHGRVTLWDAVSDHWIESFRLPDVAGVAPAHTTDSFLLTSGLGTIHQFTPDVPDGAILLQKTGTQHWDNHLVG